MGKSNQIHRTPRGHSHQNGPVHVELTSFGYLHGPLPEADITLDLRDLFRNPHKDPALIELNGIDPAVMAHVLSTKGIPNLLINTAKMVNSLLVDVAVPAEMRVFVAVGCAGGRHRSVAFAEALTNTLRETGWSVNLFHRDMVKPVVQRP